MPLTNCGAGSALLFYGRKSTHVHVLVCRDTVRHFENKEHLGGVCVLRLNTLYTIATCYSCFRVPVTPISRSLSPR